MTLLDRYIRRMKRMTLPNRHIGRRELVSLFDRYIRRRELIPLLARYIRHMKLITLLDRYIGRMIMRAYWLVLGVLLSLFLFATLVEELTRLGHGDYDLWAIIQFVALSIPQMLYQLLPFVGLLGTMLALSRLATSHELIAMRATGASSWRIARASLYAAVWLVVAVFVVGEWMVPVSVQKAAEVRDTALGETRQTTTEEFWLLQDNTFISVQQLNHDLSLKSLRVLEFSPERRLQGISLAQVAEFRDGGWHLRGVIDTRLDGQGRSFVQRSIEKPWNFRQTPGDLVAFRIRPEELPIWDLMRYIHHLEINYQQTGFYQLTLWNRLTHPLAILVMVLLAVPSVFTDVRSGGLGWNLFRASLFGIAFYVVNLGFGYVALAKNLPPAPGALLPLFLFTGFAVWVLRRAG